MAKLLSLSSLLDCDAIQCHLIGALPNPPSRKLLITFLDFFLYYKYKVYLCRDWSNMALLGVVRATENGG